MLPKNNLENNESNNTQNTDETSVNNGKDDYNYEATEENQLFGTLSLSIDSMNNEIEEIKKKYEKSLSDAEKEVDKVNKSLIKLQKKIKTLSNEKSSYLLFFGLFASILSFFSIELQIFKTVHSFWKLTGLSMIFLSLMLLFNVVIYHLSHLPPSEDKNKVETLYMVLGICFLAGIFFSFLGSDKIVQVAPNKLGNEVEYYEQRKLFDAGFDKKNESTYLMSDSLMRSSDSIKSKQQ